MVDIGRVERSAQRARRDIVAFGFAQPAHVLIHADIAVIDEFGIGDRQDFLDLLARIAPRRLARIIGRAAEQDRAAMRALAHHDNGEQLGPVAHRHHHFAADVIGLRADLLVHRDGVGRHRRGLRR
ncbi:hypothetical protein D9M73_169500 [compost metagenome]